MSRGHPAGSLAAKAHPSGSLSSSAHPDGTLTSKAHPAGTLVTRVHPPKAGGAAAAGDPFQQMVEGTTPDGTSLACWWSPNGEAAANLSTGDVAMAVMNSIANPTIKARVEDAGNWKIVADNIGTATSLTSAVEANEQTRSSATSDASLNFCGIDSAVTLHGDLEDVLDGSDSTSSGFVFFKPAANVQYQDIILFVGTNAAGQTSRFDNDTMTMKLVVGPYPATTPAATMGDIGSFPLMFAIDTSFNNDWYYIAWRKTAVSGGNCNCTAYSVKVDGTDDWSDVLSGTNSSIGSDWRGGLSFGHETWGPATAAIDGWRWGPIGMFKGDIGIGTEGTTLRTIFEAIE